MLYVSHVVCKYGLVHNGTSGALSSCATDGSVIVPIIRSLASDWVTVNDESICPFCHDSSALNLVTETNSRKLGLIMDRYGSPSKLYDQTWESILVGYILPALDRSHQVSAPEGGRACRVGSHVREGGREVALYSEVQCIMGNGHMFPLWTK